MFEAVVRGMKVVWLCESRNNKRAVCPVVEPAAPLVVDPGITSWLESPVGAGQDPSVAGTVVMTTYFTATKDPQRHRFVKESFRFMHKWHRSLTARKMRQMRASRKCSGGQPGKGHARLRRTDPRCFTSSA